MGVLDGVLGEESQVFTNDIVIVCLITHIPETTESNGNAPVASGALTIVPENCTMITSRAGRGKPFMSTRIVTRGTKCRIVGPADRDPLHGLFMPFRRICEMDLE